MGADQNTRAYRRRLNVVANNFRRNKQTESQPQFSEIPTSAKVIARTLMFFHVYWKLVLFFLWIAILGGIGVLRQC